MNGKRVHCLDIANISVSFSLQGRGLFSEFRAHAEKINPWDGVFRS